METKNHLSPFVPDWVPSIFSGDKEGMKKVFKEEGNEDFQPKFDVYLKWLEKNSPNVGIGSGAAHWQMAATNLFVDIFPKSKDAASANIGGHDDIV